MELHNSAKERQRLKQDIKDLQGRLAALQHQHGFFRMDLAFGDLAIVIGQMQLALKHPDNNGFSAERTKDVLHHMFLALESESPGISELLNRTY